jgi:two-component system, cell cycle response regulator DivK
MTKTIAIIEDDPHIQAIYQQALQSRGYRVILAAHGAEGVTIVRRERPDLVIMDLRMPIMDGWHALSYLKADARTASIPVWAISAHAADGEVVQASIGQFQFDRTFSKLSDPTQLVAEVESFLGPPGQNQLR